jgi:glutamate 5-kinase
MTQREYKKAVLRRTRRVVVKIGSQILSSGRALDEESIERLVRELAALHDRKKELVVVSSGAVAAGMTRLGIHERPKTIPQKQALAAVGQIKLMALYERYFSQFGKNVAQVLLTHEDLANRQRYLNAKHTFQTLLDSDVEGDYDRDPNTDPAAERIPLIADIKTTARRISGGAPNPFGTGGILSKLAAAEKAAAAGIPAVITSGLRAGALPAVFDEDAEVGTLVIPHGNRLTHRKHWIAYNLNPAGEVIVDDGAHEAVVARGKSLLPSGVRDVRGAFGVGECVRCLDIRGREFARGLVNYSAQELHQIKGLHTSEIEKTLGYKAYDEIIHRDDLVLL